MDWVGGGSMSYKQRARFGEVLGIAVLLAAGCGRGDSRDPTGASGDANLPVESAASSDGGQNSEVPDALAADASSSAPLDAGTSSCLGVNEGAELLDNGGFEQADADGVAAWNPNTWGNASAAVTVTNADPHSGATAAYIDVTSLPSGGGVLFEQSMTLQAGQVYNGTIWLRSDDNVVVELLLRRAASTYDSLGSHIVTVGPSWQSVEIEGGVEDVEVGNFGISFLTTGHLWIDDASLHAMTLGTCVPSAPVPPEFFGMHVNKWGTYATWPGELNFGLLRMWDTGTRWVDLEPAKGTWDFSRLDDYVQTARQAGEQVLYTMGITPQWASARPDDVSPCQAAPTGGIAEPADMTDWTDYATALATRYKGKIHYWEIWNEVNTGCFYDGSIATLVALTQAARTALLAVDPTNVVLSPNFTTTGLSAFDEFLTQGGGQYSDIIAFHLYPGLAPEDDLARITGFQNVLANASVMKPLWNTEGATSCDSSMANCPPTGESTVRALVARSLLVQWAASVGNFNWYAWDIDIALPLSESDNVTPTQAGVAYAQIQSWMVGATLTSREVDAQGNWIFTFERSGGYVGRVLWNPTQDGTLSLPASWHIARSRSLAATSTSLSGVSSLAITAEPVLIENQ
jgi:hypothetical protein